MKREKIQVIASLVILSFAGFLFWMQLKPAPKAPLPAFQQEAIESRIAFAKRVDADNAWYRQADAHGVSYTKYIPMEIAASNATIKEIDHVAERPDWKSLTDAERKRILDDVQAKGDAARKLMRDSNYAQPFQPHW